MTDKQAYFKIKQHRDCIRNKNTCDNNCKECSHSVNLLELDEALCYAMDLLKARCPELYFVENISELRKSGFFKS